MKFLKFIISLLLPLIVGGISGWITADGIKTWYQTIQKPFFNPPNWIFAPVWTTLYILMGISIFLIWISPRGENQKNAILIFLVQLGLNFFWSILFFKFHLIGWALIEIILMWFFILLMIIHFKRIKPIAAYMNYPYLAWVSFATILNAAFYWLN
jgi:translocator protein